MYFGVRKGFVLKTIKMKRGKERCVVVNLSLDLLSKKKKQLENSVWFYNWLVNRSN